MRVYTVRFTNTQNRSVRARLVAKTIRMIGIHIFLLLVRTILSSMALITMEINSMLYSKSFQIEMQCSHCASPPSIFTVFSDSQVSSYYNMYGCVSSSETGRA